MSDFEWPEMPEPPEGYEQAAFAIGASGIPEFMFDMDPEHRVALAGALAIGLVTMTMPKCWQAHVDNDELVEEIAEEAATIASEVIDMLARRFEERHLAKSLLWGTDRCGGEEDDTPQQLIGW